MGVTYEPVVKMEIILLSWWCLDITAWLVFPSLGLLTS